MALKPSVTPPFYPWVTATILIDTLVKIRGLYVLLFLSDIESVDDRDRGQT